MKYPPNFKGFFRAAFDTIVKHPNNYPRKKHHGKDNSGKESYWQLKDYQVYEPDKDPGKEFWQKKAEELVERKAQEKLEAEKRMIEDYEFRHKDDRETKQPDSEANKDEKIKNESDSDDKPAGKESAESESAQKETEQVRNQDAADAGHDDSSGKEDFHADVGIEFDEDFGDDF